MKIKVIFDPYCSLLGAIYNPKIKCLGLFVLPTISLLFMFCKHKRKDWKEDNFQDRYKRYKCPDCNEDVYEDM